MGLWDKQFVAVDAAIGHRSQYQMPISADLSEIYVLDIPIFGKNTIIVVTGCGGRSRPKCPPHTISTLTIIVNSTYSRLSLYGFGL